MKKQKRKKKRMDKEQADKEYLEMFLADVEKLKNERESNGKSNTLEQD